MKDCFVLENNLSLAAVAGRLSSLDGGDLVDMALGGVATSLNAMSKKSSIAVFFCVQAMS